MVSFICNYCQETIKKPKLDQHAQRCPNHSFSCVDCMTDFVGTSYRTHTQCMSEAEKYQKSLYRPQKQKNAAAKGVVPGITKSAEQSFSEDQSYAKRKQLDDSNQHSKKSKTAGSKDLLTVIKTTAKELLEKKRKISLSKLIKWVTKKCQQAFPKQKGLKKTVTENLLLRLTEADHLELI